MPKYLAFLMTGLFLMSLSCRRKELSSLVDQNDIFLSYTLSYDEYYNKTYANARFFLEDINGKRLELSQNSRVFYNGVELEATRRRGTNYTATLDGYFSGAVMDWNDTEGTQYLNTLEIPAPIDVQSQYADSWASTWGHDVYWIGDSLGLNEQVLLTLEVNEDTSFTIEVLETTQGRQHVHIPAWRMEELAGFTASMRIQRIRYETIQESPAAGGQIQTSYITDGGWLYAW